MDKVFSFTTDASGSLMLNPCEAVIDFAPAPDMIEDMTPLDIEACTATMLNPERAALSFARDMRFALQIACAPSDLASVIRTDEDMLVISVVPEVTDASFAVDACSIDDRRAFADALRALADQVEAACDEAEEAEEEAPQARLSA